MKTITIHCLKEIDYNIREVQHLELLVEHLAIIINRLLNQKQEIKVVLDTESAEKIAWTDANLFWISDSTSDTVIQQILSRKETSIVFTMGYKPEVVPAHLIVYYLFEYDNDKRECVSLWEGGDLGYFYWQLLTNIAYDVLEQLSLLESLESEHSKVFFINESSPDIYRESLMLKRELKSFGHRVVPYGKLSSNKEKLEKQLEDVFSQADLALFLFGSVYTDTDKEEMNKTLLQYEAAIKAEKQKLLWVAPHGSEIDEKQLFLIDRIIRQSEGQANTEVVEGVFQKLKYLLHLYLYEFVEKSKNWSNLHAEQVIQGYLVADKIDEQWASEVAALFESEGGMSTKTFWDIPQTYLRKAHQSYLNQCRGVFVLVDKVNTYWLEARVRDILKTPGMGRGERIPFQWIIVRYKNQVSQVNSHLEKLQLEGVRVCCWEDKGDMQLGDFLLQTIEQS